MHTVVGLSDKLNYQTSSNVYPKLYLHYKYITPWFVQSGIVLPFVSYPFGYFLKGRFFAVH